MDLSTCEWGGFTPVLSTLDFWRGWLVSSLKYSPPGGYLSVLVDFYRTADPLASALGVALLFALLCFLLSLPTNRHSWVDKLWSLTPVYYAWHFALHDQLSSTGAGAGAPVPTNPRLLAIASLVTIWGTRLTWNFARKGGYRWADEDYRWPWLRDRVHPFLFFIFNVTFIAVIQHVLLLAIVAPSYLAWQHVGAPPNVIDAVATALVAYFILFETVTDQQQWAFQSTKHALLRAGKELPPRMARGFCTTGLFRYSRHPNFWAEQCIWWSMYLFGVAASGRWLNWTLAGPIFLSMLFQGSTWLTELITSAKYPTYAAYQRTTSRLMPWFPGEPAEDEGEEEEEEEETGVKTEDEVEDEPAPSTRRRSSAAAKKAASPAKPTVVESSEEEEEEEEERFAENGEDEESAEEESEEEEAPRQPRSRRSGAVPHSGVSSGSGKARGSGRGRKSVPGTATAAVGEAGEAEEEETEAVVVVKEAAPSRTPRKSAKALPAEAPVRKSSRLRAKASGTTA